jgi:hypothetical protein
VESPLTFGRPVSWPHCLTNTQNGGCLKNFFFIFFIKKNFKTTLNPD